MIISEVRDAVELLSDLVDQTRTILEALEDGRAYMQKYYPNATRDLAALLEQMRTTIAGAIDATSPITRFDFTVEGDNVGLQPTRFNDYMREVDDRINETDADVHRLHGSCERIRRLSKTLQRRAHNTPWWALLGDRAGQRANELSPRMRQLYGQDLAMVDQLRVVLQADRAALDAVRAELTKDGGASVRNVSAAQAVMRDQQDALKPVVDDLRRCDRFAGEIAALDPAA
jgi:hypothetical protein